MNSNDLYRFSDVNYRYPDGNRGLVNCNLSIKRGERTAIMGVNGAGKTTLLQMLNGILRPDSGLVSFADAPLDYSRNGLRSLRSKAGFLFQNPDNQLLSASVREDVSFGPINLGLDLTEVARRVEYSLQMVGMSGYADRPVHALSHGQKKRICIAGLLAMQPELLILDEPMAGLDQQMQTELEDILETLHKQGMSIIFASHDIDFIYRRSDHVLLMGDGSCKGQVETKNLASLAETLLSLGLNIPVVMRIYQALTDKRFLKAASEPPRCMDELLDSIRQQGIKTEP